MTRPGPGLERPRGGSARWVTLLHLDLLAEPDAVARARCALDALGPRVGEARLFDLRLLVSEVVTNAVRHGSAERQARVLLLAFERTDCLRIEVHDEGPGFRAPPEPAPRASGTSGWGLFLLQKLSRRWGSQTAPGAHVWFELAV